jgi:tetratricopeptide (TPR) repeat protein
LDTGINILKNKARDVAVRHQTIRNTIKWSYDLLDASEQQLFQQLALFRSGFTLESLEVIYPKVDPIEVVESFMNKSLIVKDKEVHLVPRFRMLKLIRDFGLEQLEENPKRADFYSAFSYYFMSFIQKHASKFRGKDQAKWIALLEAEYENLLEALEWLTSNQPELGARMGVEFWPFHLNRGFLREGLAMIEKLLTLTIRDKLVHARLLEGAGILTQNLGRYSNAKDYQKECLDICEALQDKAEVAKALNNLGWAEWRIGNYEQTKTYSEKALEIFHELNDFLGQAKSLNNIAWANYYTGLYENSANLQRKVLAIHTQASNQKGIAFAKINLGRALIYTGKIVEAEKLINEGYEVFKNLKNQQLSTFSLLIKAEYHYENQAFKMAEDLLQDHCLPEFKKIGDVWGIATSHNHLGAVGWQTKAFDEAESHFEKALYLFSNSNDVYGETSSTIWLAKLHDTLGHHTQALKHLDSGIQLAAGIQAMEWLKEGCLQKVFYTQRNDSIGSAIKFLTLADHYAQQQGAYAYQKFQVQIRELKAALKHSLGVSEERAEFPFIH